MIDNYEEWLQYNRDANKRILEAYYIVCERRREREEYRLLHQALQHLYQQLRYYTEYFTGKWYTPEGYTRLVLVTMLTYNMDVYPYLDGQYGYGPYVEHFSYLLTNGTTWYKKHLYWPPYEHKEGVQLRLFNQP